MIVKFYERTKKTPAIARINTYSKNNALHNSSALVKAYNALQVAPKTSNWLVSKTSNSCINNSSVNCANSPALALELIEDVYAFPAGLTPSGWDGIAFVGRSSSAAKDTVLMRFEGRQSLSLLSAMRTPGAIVQC